MVLYGVVVVGPPGSGKSTMCAGLARYFELMKRPCVVANLDPACEEFLTPFTIDVRNLCRVDEVQREHSLGANGGLMYCISQMRHSPWVYEKLASLGDKSSRNPFVLFDLPGQVELWTHSDDLKEMLLKIVHDLDARLVVAHVVDANHCTRPENFVAASLVSLTAMLKLELPHVNVLSKLDQLSRIEGAMPFNLHYFLESRQLDRLVPFCGESFSERDRASPTEDVELPRSSSGLRRLSAKICELIEEFNLVCYQPLDISDGESVGNLVAILDKAIGHPAAAHKIPKELTEISCSHLFLNAERRPSDEEFASDDPASKVTKLGDGRTFRTHRDPESETTTKR